MICDLDIVEKLYDELGTKKPTYIIEQYYLVKALIALKENDKIFTERYEQFRKKAVKIISGGVYLCGLLLCISNPTGNDPILKQIVGLVLVIISVPVLISSLGGLDD